MSELQATIEIQVELSKFYNVDLFQRGYYQLRTYLKTPPKSPIKVEVSLPRNSDCHLVFPASMINGVAVSKTFQILYRNEDVTVNDVVLFKIHTLVDAQKIEESLNSTDLQLAVDLWFTDEEFGPEQQEKLACISQRTLKLHFLCTKGLHHHIPILFDYFHLSVICVTVHATLVALHQPYLNLKQTPKSGWNRGSDHATLESVLFGSRSSISASAKGSRGSTGNLKRHSSLNHIKSKNQRYAVNPRLQQACQVHRNICNVLLSAYESLQQSLHSLISKMPNPHQLKLELVDCHRRLDILCEIAQTFENEEDLLQTAQSDVAQLCAENVILWNRYLEAVTLSDRITFQIAREHHNQRVKRLAEGFFTYEFPKQAAIACFDPSIHGHTEIAAMVRASHYFQTLQPLAAESWEMDGDYTTLPLIFEDVYCEASIVKELKTTQSEEVSASPVWASSDSGIEDSGRARKNSRQSDTSSVHSGDSSPRMRKSKLKFIKNIRPEAFKRPSSFIVQDPGTAAQGQVAVDHTDCTLVGYRKINHSNTITLVGLGTLSPHDEPEAEGSEDTPTKSPLFNAMSLPTLVGQSHSSIVSSGSLPELCNRDSLSEDVQPDILASAQSGISGSSDSSLRTGVEGGPDRASVISGKHELVPEKLINGIERNADDKSRSSSVSPSDSSAASGGAVENGFVDAVESAPTQESNDSSSKDCDKTQTESESAGMDYKALADTLTKALGEPEEEEENKDNKIVNKELSTIENCQTSVPKNDTCVQSNRNSGSLNDIPESEITEMTSFSAVNGSGVESDRKSPERDETEDKDNSSGVHSASTSDNVAGEEEGSLVDSSYIDAPLSDSTKDKLTLGSSSDSQSLDTLPSSSDSQTADSSGMSRQNTDDSSYMTTECTVLELLREEYERSQTLPVADDSSLFGSALLGPSVTLTDSVKSQEGKDKEKDKKPSGGKTETNSNPVGGSSGTSQKASGNQGSNKPVTSQPKPLAQAMLMVSSSTPDLSTLSVRDKPQRLVSPVPDDTISFITAKENLRRHMKYSGHIYSDFPTQASIQPYFWPPELPRSPNNDGIHLIVCVHGLDGNSADLRLVRTYLEMAMPGGRVDFLMSERNQPDTFADFEVMTDRLVQEILYHVEMYSLNPSRISFVGHSLGNLIIRSTLARQEMAPLLPKLYTFLSLSGPHLGTLYNSSGLVNMGMWFMQKWKKSGSLLQLSLKDHPDPRQSFLYKLSTKPGMELFRNILLVGSSQDRYVPFHSSRIELCKAAMKDSSGMGSVYAEMVSNILQPIVYKSDITFVRFDVFHALPNTANSLIGRAAHIAVLDSELFIEKFLTVSALKYFK